MHSSYECTLNGQIVGTVEIVKTGLYYCIKCRCKLLKQGIYRLYVSTAVGQQKLGVCVPNKGVFCYDTKIPTSKLGENVMGFYLLEDDTKEIFRFYPLDTCSVTDFLPDLSHAFFTVKDGVKGIGIKQKEQETQDNDPSP